MIGRYEVYAVVRLAGKQVTVKPEEQVEVPLLDAEVGSIIRCDDILLYSDGADVRVGKPQLDGVSVTAEVIEHGRKGKITVLEACT